MEWGSAKKFVIVLLFLLNAGLFLLNYNQQKEYTMTAAQEKAIFQVLSENGISMYTDLEMNAAPMFRLEAEVPTYNKEELERLFFEGEKTRVSLGGEIGVYKTESRILTLKGSTGVLEINEVEKGAETLDKATGTKIAKAFMEQLEPTFGAMELNNAVYSAEGWHFSFCGSYQGEPVFSNRFEVSVSDEGIYRVAFAYCKVKGHSGEKKEISTGDEALLAFMREWVTDGKSADAAIQKMELGYYLPDQGTVAGGLFLEPCYAIYLMEEREPYLIHAYTGKVIGTNNDSSQEEDIKKERSGS